MGAFTAVSSGLFFLYSSFPDGLKATLSLMGVHLHTRCTSAKTAPECGCYQIVFQGSDLNVYYITFTLSIVQGRLYEEAEGKSELLKINRKKKRANDIISSFVMPLCIFEIFIAKACSYVEAAHHRVFL